MTGRQRLLGSFGSGVVVPGTGVLMNNGMAWLNTDPGTKRADVVTPYQHQFVPVIPTVALTGARQPLFALGTPGGYGIPQTTLQVLANILFHDDALQSAVDKPRVTVGVIVPERGQDRDVNLEPGFAPEVYQEMQAAEADEACRNFGRFHAVQLTPDGVAMAINDSRDY